MGLLSFDNCVDERCAVEPVLEGLTQNEGMRSCSLAPGNGISKCCGHQVAPIDALHSPAPPYMHTRTYPPSREQVIRSPHHTSSEQPPCYLSLPQRLPTHQSTAQNCTSRKSVRERGEGWGGVEGICAMLCLLHTSPNPGTDCFPILSVRSGAAQKKISLPPSFLRTLLLHVTSYLQPLTSDFLC